MTTTSVLSSKGLKAMGYDTIYQIEMLQQRLKDINQAIARQVAEESAPIATKEEGSGEASKDSPTNS